VTNFTQRTLTGFFFVLIITTAIAWGAISYAALFLIITFLGCNEFYNLIQSKYYHSNAIIASIIGAILFLLVFLVTSGTLNPTILFIPIILIFLLFTAELFIAHPDPFKNLAFTLVGIFYIALPFSMLNLLVINKYTNYLYNGNMLLAYFFLLWANDTGAYLVGRWLGKHKLLERISPNKTWEGFIGGVFMALLVSLICSIYFIELNRLDWMIIALIISVFGTLGDLIESMLKRSIGVKDSGTILPGHGGVLDRFDGLIGSIHFVIFYLFLVKQY
jgi:phosphatidate cytidylyltransferase